MHRFQVEIGSEQARDEDNTGTVAFRYAHAVINRRSVEQEQLRSE
jgi:hypothetical protein